MYLGNGPTFGRNGQLSGFIWLAEGFKSSEAVHLQVKIVSDTEKGLDNTL